MKPKTKILRSQVENLIKQGYDDKEVAKELGIATSLLIEKRKEWGINRKKMPHTIIEFIDDSNIQPDKEPLIDQVLLDRFKKIEKEIHEIILNPEDIYNKSMILEKR